VPIDEEGCGLGSTAIIKLLAQGQLPASKGTLYTVPAGVSAIIKLVSYVNSSSVIDERVNLYIKKPGENSRRVIPTDMLLTATFAFYYDEETTLEAGDTIEGDATDALTVDYTINGIEK
jgi:hypothetical protein